MAVRAYFPKRLYTGRWWLSATLLATVFALGSSVQAQLPVALDGAGNPTLAPLMQQVTPAVVNVAVVSTVQPTEGPAFADPFFRRFFQLPEQGQAVPRQSAGSGVIVDANSGYILTNNHVIEDADEITVTLADRRSFPAKLVGSDPGTDVALLQVDAPDLTALKLADSDQVRVGDFVVAIGNPFGLGQTVTSGIVSALGRSGINVEGYEDFIQTDASINPGNSGGALVDLDGRLVGINSAIISPGGGNVGIGFAVPSNMASAVMAQLLKYGEVRRGRLGVMIQDLTPELAKALQLSVDEGAVVTQVEPKSPAEKAGILPGDVITGIDDRSVEGAADLRNRIGLLRAGETTRISLMRDGRTRELQAELAETPSASLAGGESVDRLKGSEFRNLEPDDPQYGKLHGVLVVAVEHDSPAWRAGLRPDDIVLAVNRRSVGSVDELAHALSDAGEALALNVQRGDARLFIVLQ